MDWSVATAGGLFVPLPVDLRHRMTPLLLNRSTRWPGVTASLTARSPICVRVPPRNTVFGSFLVIDISLSPSVSLTVNLVDLLAERLQFRVPGTRRREVVLGFRSAGTGHREV